jgi:hypothetical protein
MIELSNEEVIEIYNDQVERIMIYAKRQHKPYDWCIGALRTNFDWLRYLSPNDRVFEHTIVPFQDLSIETRQQYKHPEMGDVIKILHYRNRVIPIYDDDYGQQEVAIIDGQEIGAGTYNFFSTEEFMDAVDLIEYYTLVKEVDSYYGKDE